MNVATPRTRRLVSYALLVLGLLPLLYVTSALSISFAYTAGWIPQSVIDVLSVAYRPLGWYVNNDYPGAGIIEVLVRWASDAGDRFAP